MSDGPDPHDGPIAALQWFLQSQHDVVALGREIVSCILAVAIVGMLLFAVSGLWPPFVAVESGSMQPHLTKGDFVFVAEEHRFSPEQTVNGTGIVTYQLGEQTGYTTFQQPGSVIVYSPNGNPNRTPVIHRARFWVNENENWYGKVNSSYVEGAKNCRQLEYCPAPYSGFITKGDHNGYYDQVSTISAPVKPSWIKGTAEFKIPWLGWVRLSFTGDAMLRPPFGSQSRNLYNISV